MALVWIMVPGVGFFYSGLLRRKNALSMIYLSMMTIAVVSFQVTITVSYHVLFSLSSQWFFWGFSLTFSDTGNKFIGDLRKYSVSSFKRCDK
jgi:Amt family ammonium transporter